MFHKQLTQMLIYYTGAYHEERVLKWRDLVEHPVVEEVVCETVGDVTMDAEGVSEESMSSLEISTTSSEKNELKINWC